MNSSAYDVRQSTAQTNKFRRLNLSDFRRVIFGLLLLIAAGCLSSPVYAQTESVIDDVNAAPPPLKILSKAEKSQLAAVSEIGKRTKLALELMEARLVNAENYSLKEDYREMFNELGGFHAVVDNTLAFLKSNNNDSRKVLSNFKRVELSLRKYITRLELIRRELPIEYESYVRQLTKDMRDARTAAVEPMFDDLVLPQSRQPE